MILVCGLGATGLSLLSFAKKTHQKVIGFDTRNSLPMASRIQSEYPGLQYYLGSLPEDILNEVSTVWISPGFDIKLLGKQFDDACIQSDIQLFAENAKAPIIAITGTNGKSTVTTMVTDMINAAGKKAVMGGNIGIPALELLHESVPDYYVLELSSFQLQHTSNLGAKVACILNISPDHLDRHPDFDSYRKAKKRIFEGAEQALDLSGEFSQERLLDSLLSVIPSLTRNLIKMGISEFQEIPDQVRDDRVSKGMTAFNATEESGNLRTHSETSLQTQNKLAALHITAPLNLPTEPQFEALKNFKGLKHRLQNLGQKNGVTYINDSKATNVGACIAAVESLVSNFEGKIILLLGGVGKGQDFLPLRDIVQTHTKAVIVYGEAKNALKEALPFAHESNTMSNALKHAEQLASKGDVILLSPACASFDEFKNFEHRGEVFEQILAECYDVTNKP